MSRSHVIQLDLHFVLQGNSFKNHKKDHLTSRVQKTDLNQPCFLKWNTLKNHEYKLGRFPFAITDWSLITNFFVTTKDKEHHKEVGLGAKSRAPILYFNIALI